MGGGGGCCCGSWVLSGGGTEGGTEVGDAGAAVACVGAEAETGGAETGGSETSGADGLADGDAVLDPRGLLLPRGTVATCGDGEGADRTCTGGTGGAGLPDAC